MKYLIIGLGNPGAKYTLTRHNVGFLVLDKLARRFDASFETAKLAEKTEIKHKGRILHLIKPNTFMNLSGKAVNYWMQELKIEKENILVIVDDIALDHNQLRMKPKGSAGGHNGLTNIEQLTGGANYARLKFGVGNDFHKGQQSNYVLSNFTEEQLDALPEYLDKAGDMILSFATIGIQLTMTQFNS